MFLSHIFKKLSLQNLIGKNHFPTSFTKKVIVAQELLYHAEVNNSKKILIQIMGQNY